MNECTREKVGIAPIVKMMVELCFRQFGHWMRKPIKAWVRRVVQIEGGLTGRDRGR